MCHAPAGLDHYFLENSRAWNHQLRINKSIAISATAVEIWPLLTEPGNILRWCPVETIRHTGPQRAGLNTAFYFEERVIGQLLRMNFVVTEWVVNRRVAFKMTSGNFVKGYEQIYTIENIPSGSRFSCCEDVKLPYGFLGRAAGIFRRFTSEARLERMLVKLKSIAEARETLPSLTPAS
jgi:hypothetical protein